MNRNGAAAAVPYKRVGVSPFYDETNSTQTTQQPPLTTTLKEVNADVESLKRMQRLLMGLLVFLSLLLMLLLIGGVVWLALVTRNTNDQQATLNTLGSNVTTINENLMQLIVEMHGNITVLQNGTFGWVMAKTLGTQAPDFIACAAPEDWVNQNATPLLASYELQNVQLGSLNFTILVLNPPSEALVYSIENDNPSLLHMCLVQFTPTVPLLDTLNVNGPRVFPFTAPNLARLDLQPPCTTETECNLIPSFTEQFAGTNAYSVAPTTTGAPNTDAFYLQWFYVGGPFMLGATFTLTESVRLILLSS